MWQRFTEAARKAVLYAQEEAQGLGEGYVSTEHLLLGALREANPATRALERLGIDPAEVRRETKQALPEGEMRPIPEMTLTPRAKRVIDLAYDEARGLNHDHIGTEHLLLGLLREGDGLAARVLKKFGVSLESLRAVIIEMYDQASLEAPPAEGWVDQIKVKMGLKPKPDVVYSDIGLPKRTQHYIDMEQGLQSGAKRLGIRIIGTHDWLALMLEDETCDAYRMLQLTGADLDSMRARIQQIRQVPPAEGDHSLSPFARMAEQSAALIATELWSKKVSTGHVLVAISKAQAGLAAVLLSEAGISYEHLYILAGQVEGEE